MGENGRAQASGKRGKVTVRRSARHRTLIWEVNLCGGTTMEIKKKTSLENKQQRGEEKKGGVNLTRWYEKKKNVDSKAALDARKE